MSSAPLESASGRKPDETGSQDSGVLLLAYGGPDRLEDIPEYLLAVRGGRETPAQLVDEITKRYRLIGGFSPLLQITRSAARQLQERLQLPVFVGMRNWQPYIADVVAEMSDTGIAHAVVICMAPHYSMLSIAKYRDILYDAVAVTGSQMKISFIESWHMQQSFIRGIAANVTNTLDRWPAEERDSVKVVFTAHSLPEFILGNGDPYDRQLRETASLLAESLDLSKRRWILSYQSAPRTGARWLGPQVEDLVVSLAEKGERNLLIAPIGFLSDHVEILYDIDIGVKEIATRHGLTVERTPMLNDSAPLVDALAELAADALQPVPA